MPVRTLAISLLVDPGSDSVGTNSGMPLPSKALCSALFTALIQLLMSSSDVAWYTRVKLGVMTSKQKRLSALRASRTEAIRKSIGSMCKSILYFQFMYSEIFPWSSTIQNLQWLAALRVKMVYCLLMPRLFI